MNSNRNSLSVQQAYRRICNLPGVPATKGAAGYFKILQLL